MLDAGVYSNLQDNDKNHLKMAVSIYTQQATIFDWPIPSPTVNTGRFVF